ncbi:proline-rich protein 5-like isoform X1 [Sebastes fasciatus]|uniref:proline-rich protein 5-like isoform X1 n=1 Tax=Sebastes fasciatus TaxID=394691 RepID=UPI003D9E5CB9
MRTETLFSPLSLSFLFIHTLMEWGYVVPFQLPESLHSKLRLGSSSSSSLTDLSQAKTPAGVGDYGGTTGGMAEECSRDKGTQQRRAGSNATWNSIHNAVISVFQRKDLGENELYTLNEGVRQLLKTELGSFFTEYLQNQLLTKGMVILRDKIRFYEGQKLLDSLADTWDFFFCDVLSMLQAIFYPVQGKEPSVRQMALLHFRNIITLNLKLDEAMCRPRARVPPSIIQMLLILQGVHESKGVTDDYLRLESLIQKVVSPYLGTHGLYSRDGSSNLHCSSCLLEKRLQRSWPSKPGSSPISKNPVVRSKSYNVPMLTPVVEYDVDSSMGSCTGIRRHSVSEMTSCLEESSSLAESTTTNNTSNTSTSSLANHSPASTASAALSVPTVLCTDTVTSSQDPQPGDADGPAGLLRLQPQHHSPCILPEPSPGEDTHCSGSLVSDSPASSSRLLAQDTSSGPSPSSSPEIMTDHVPESLDSEPEPDGIFLDFSRHCPGGLDTQQINANVGTCANNTEP